MGELARKYFPRGVLIAENFRNLEDSQEATRQAISAGAGLVYEATFRHESVLARVDILKKALTAENSWDLIEVKNAAAPKQAHIMDLAVQYFVLSGAGLNINRALLMFLNTDYVRLGELDLHQLFKFSDITAQVEAALPHLSGMIEDFESTLAGPREPIEEVGRHCSRPHHCEFIPYCWGHLPKDDIVHFPFLRWPKIEALKERGINRLGEIPEDLELRQNQRLWLQVAKSGRPHIESAALKEFLETLHYPVYFLDFETTGPAIPIYDGTKPFDHVPFQFSLRILSRDGTQHHVEFLGDGARDPRPEMAALLARSIGPEGSVVAYYAPFEGKILELLAQAEPEYEKELRQIRCRLWDLLTPFARNYYVHPDFKGSSSIKAVLPALVPDMTYKNLTIQRGMAASYAYGMLVSRNLPRAEAAALRQSLLEYCGQDTLAMVKILEFLQREVN